MQATPEKRALFTMAMVAVIPAAAAPRLLSMLATVETSSGLDMVPYADVA